MRQPYFIAVLHRRVEQSILILSHWGCWGLEVESLELFAKLENIPARDTFSFVKWDRVLIPAIEELLYFFATYLCDSQSFNFLHSLPVGCLPASISPSSILATAISEFLCLQQDYLCTWGDQWSGNCKFISCVSPEDTSKSATSAFSVHSQLRQRTLKSAFRAHLGAHRPFLRLLWQ